MRAVALAFFVEAPQELFKFRFLFGCQNRANFIPAFLADGLDLSVGLVVNGFRFAMPMRQDAIQLFRLLRSQRQLLGHFRHAIRSPLRLAERSIGRANRAMRKQIAQHAAKGRTEQEY